VRCVNNYYLKENVHASLFPFGCSKLQLRDEFMDKSFLGKLVHLPELIPYVQSGDWWLISARPAGYLPDSWPATLLWQPNDAAALTADAAALDVATLLLLGLTSQGRRCC